LKTLHTYTTSKKNNKPKNGTFDYLPSPNELQLVPVRPYSEEGRGLHHCMSKRLPAAKEFCYVTKILVAGTQQVQVKY